MTITTVSELLLGVAEQSAVELLSRRTLKPELAAAGRAFRVYSIIEPVREIAAAYRIAAYSDVGLLLATQVVVHVASKTIATTLEGIGTINYTVHREAETVLAQPDFADPASPDIHALDWPNRALSGFVVRDWRQSGGLLVRHGFDSVARACRAFHLVNRLMEHSETRSPRRSRNWDRPSNLFDRVNQTIGSAFWHPPPEIGLGTRRVSDQGIYSGTFRRDNAEGYGRLSGGAGDWLGQVRGGRANGYGVNRWRDGRVFVGYLDPWAGALGASIDAGRMRVVFGSHDGHGHPEGYARQIGVNAGRRLRSSGG